MRWHFNGKTLLDGCVALSYKIEYQVRVERERLGLDDRISVLQQNGLRWYGHTLKLRVPGQEVNQRKLGERLWKKTARHVS